MTCQVKDNSIKHLIKKGAINENRKIINLDKFNETNYQVTEYAVRKYGLKTDGAMLFTNTVTEKIDKRASSYRRNAYYETARAVPNEVLFQELQVLKDQYDNVANNPTILPKQKPGEQLSLFGQKTSAKDLIFSNSTLGAINTFIDTLGVNIELTSFPSSDILAAANFMNKTIEISDDFENRVSAWNKLPEEAAHWWYRLLKADDSMKKELWDLALASEKRKELESINYGAYQNTDALTEEAIGQIIAESIKRIESKKENTADSSFWNKFKNWISKILNNFKKQQQTPFDIAAAKILASDVSDLMSVEEYAALYNQASVENILANIDEQVNSITGANITTSSEPDYFDYLIGKKYKIQSRYLKKTIAKLQEGLKINDPIASFSKEDIEYFKKEKAIEDITLTLSSKIDVLTKYKKGIALKSPIAINGVKKEEINILNTVREKILNENPNLKTISAEEFLEEAANYINAKYALSAVVLPEKFAGYRIINTFESTKKIFHKKIGVHINKEYFKGHGHWGQNPFAWYTVTPFNIDEIEKKYQDKIFYNSALIHEIQTDFLDRLSSLQDGAELAKRFLAVKNTKNDFYFDTITQNLARNDEYNASFYESFKHKLEEIKGTYDYYKTSKEDDNRIEEYRKDIDNYYTVARAIEGLFNNKEYWENIANEAFITTKGLSKEQKTDFKKQAVDKIIYQIAGKLDKENNLNIDKYGPYVTKYIRALFMGKYNAGHFVANLKRPDNYVSKINSSKWQIKNAQLNKIKKQNFVKKYDKMNILTEPQFKDLYNNFLKRQAMLESVTMASDMITDTSKIDFYKDFTQTYLTPLIHHAIQSVRASKSNPEDIRFAGGRATILTQGNWLTAELYAGPEEVFKGSDEEKLKIYKEVAQELLPDAKYDLYGNDIALKKIIESNTYNEARKLMREETKKGVSTVVSWGGSPNSFYAKVYKKAGDKFLEVGPIYTSLSKIKGVKYTYEPTPGLINNTESYKLDLSNYNLTNPVLYGISGSKQTKPEISEAPAIINEVAGETIPLVDIDLNTINSARSKEVAEVLAERLSRGLKVDYENITPEDAKNILKNSPVPYRGEPAFYFAGKVYIVGDNVNVHTVLHEFSHPLLQGIRKTNPTLFNNLFDQLAGTEEGQGIIDYVKKHYPELNPDGQLFKEEALAFALQLKSLNKVNNQIETEGFENFINKLLAAIKQMLRGIFGNTVTVSKLDVDTTLDELADMLLEKDFEFETDKVTEDDLVMYGRFVVERADELVKLSNTEAMIKIINEIFATNKALLLRAKEFKTDKAVRAIVEKALLKEGTTELLPAIDESLRSYQDISVSGKLNSSQIIDNALDAENKRLDEMRNRAVALVNSLDKINSISKNMMKDLSRIYLEKNINARNTIGLVNLYKNNAYAWQNTIGEINSILGEFDIDTSNPFYQVINEITTNLSKVQTKIADIYKKNNVQFFVEITGYMNEFVNNELKSNLGIALKKAFPEGELEKAVNTLYNSVIQQNLSDAEIEELVKKGVPRDVLEKFIKKYNDYVVNEDKIKEALTGHAKDVSWFNRWLESYSSSNDIIVGPLSMFIQDQKTEVENEVWKKSMEFRKKLETLLPKVGFSKLNSTQIRDMVSGLDTIMTFDKKTGKPVAKEIYTFLNEFNNGWRYTQDLLEYNYEEAKKTGDKEKIAKALTELRQFNTDYMWQEFTPEYYEKDDIFKNSEIGGLAYVARKQALDEYNNIQNQFDKELERFDNYSAIEGAWRKYQQLYSLYYENGSPKVDDPSKGIYDLSIAKLLLEHKEATKDFNEFVSIPGSLQTSYNEFVTSLEAQNIKRDSDEFDKKLKKWKKQNIKVVYSDEYYAERKRLHTRRQELQSRINELMQSEFDISGAYKTINDLIFSYRDEFGQPNPNELGPKRLKMIRDLEQQILDFKSKFDKKSGLTKEQSAELELLSEKAKRGELNEAESKRYVYLLQLLKNAGINVKDALELKGIFEDLKSMSNKVPTDYYLDALNHHLSELNIEEVDEEDVDAFINTPEFQNLVDSDENFREWFDLHHVVTYRFNFKTKLEEAHYQRTAANSVTIPSNPKYYKTTTIFDTETEETITLMGVPNSRHSRFEVKDKYRTIPRGAVRQEYVGKYIDNKGNYLPRSFVPGSKNSAKDDKFIDKRYAQLKASNSAEYQLLEAMKEYHLKVQEGQTNYGKLYLDMPRYATKATDVYQIIQRGKYGERYKEMGKNIVEGIKQTFGTSVADNENGYNYNPENNLVNTDMAGNEISYIPVTGVYNLDVEVTDADVLQGLFKYSLSLQTQGKLLESLPLVESILSTLEDPANKPKNIDRFSKAAFNVRNKLQNTNKQGAENNRLGQVRSLIEREYYGKQVVGLEENYPRLGKWLGVLQKLSSRGSLMLNIPSDIKNQFSGYIQTIIEGSGGEFITLKDIALATPWATKAMLDWTTKGIYQVGPGEMSTQLVEIFDPTFKAEDNFGRSVTRSLAKDLVNGEWLYMHRKFGEMDVAMKLFGSFLHGQKIDQTLSNGKKISIRYVDAWEKDANGIAKLKDGIHPGWNNTAVYHTYTKGETLEEIAKKYYIDVEELQAKNHIKATTQLEDGQEIIIAKSEKFKAFKNKMQGTSRRLFGVYDKFGQPEGNKYIMYRMFFFMRKWFTPMLVNRFGMDVSKENFGGARYDWALGKTTKGYYVSAFQTLVGLLKSKGSSYAYMTPQEKTDLKRTMSEGLTIIMTALLASALFGYDDDDEDKWKKIAARSEAIGQDGFKTYGFLTNHALLLVLGLQAETGAFVPLPKVFGLNLGADDYTKMITSTSSAFYNTVILYTEIFGDVLNFITLNDAAIYKKDTGPYWWQQKGERKIWKRLFATVGFTGGTGDPETAIKNISKSSGKLR